MSTIELKVEELNKATYLTERDIISSEGERKDSIQSAEEWLKKSGLSLVSFKKKLQSKGISYNQFLYLLESKNSPSPKNIKWYDSLQVVLKFFTEFSLGDKSNNSLDIGIFVHPFTTYFREKLREDLATSQLDFINVENFVESCVQHLYRELRQVSDKTVVLEFHELKESQPNLDFNTYIEQYLLDINYIRAILNRYPVLARILTESTQRFMTNTKTLVLRYNQDYMDIKNIFLKEEAILQSVSFGLGDNHKNGQTVSILEFNNGDKLIYKPRSLATDISFERLLTWLNNKNLSYNLVNMKSLSREGHGWQQFIEHKPCYNEEEIKEYYYRMGANIAIFYLLRTNDMHYENIIASGPVPYVIDLETLLSNSIYNDEIMRHPLKELLRSVLGSGALPTGQVFESRFDFDMSAISGKPKQTSDNMTGWVMVEDQEGSYKYEQRNFVTSTESHLVKFNNKIVEPIEYLGDIEKGFIEVYKVFLDSKEESYKKITQLFKGTEYRIVLRPTFMYFKFLIASQHPSYLQNGLDREKLLGMLWNITKSEKKFDSIVESEIEDLLNNDIPYFTYLSDSKGLYNSKGKEIGKVFDQTSIEIIEQQFLRLNTQDLDNQLNLIRLSLHANTAVGKETNQVESLLSIDKHIFSEGINSLQMAEEIGDFLVTRAINDYEGKSTTWIGIESIDNSFQFKTLDFSLYNGMLGVTLFLAQLYQYSPKIEYKETVYRNVHYIQNVMKNIKGKMTNSVFNGIGALAYSFHYLASLFNDDYLRNIGDGYLIRMKNIKEEFSQEENSDEGLKKEEIDFMDGHAGIITFLINLYETTKSEVSLQLAKIYGNDLREKILNKEVIPSLLGLAHGTSGIVMALTKLKKYEDNPSNEKIIVDLINYEKKYFDKSRLNWLDLRDNVSSKNNSFYWCHGAPGILLSRIGQEKEIHLEKEIIDNLLTKHMNTDRIGLCHGVFGNLDILLSLAEKYPNLSIEQVRELGTKFLNQETVQSKLQNMKDKGLFGLMMGISGVGCALLRLYNPTETPSILSLQLPSVRELSLR